MCLFSKQCEQHRYLERHESIDGTCRSYVGRNVEAWKPNGHVKTQVWTCSNEVEPLSTERETLEQQQPHKPIISHLKVCVTLCNSHTMFYYYLLLLCSILL